MTNFNIHDTIALQIEDFRGRSTSFPNFKVGIGGDTAYGLHIIFNHSFIDNYNNKKVNRPLTQE